MKTKHIVQIFIMTTAIILLAAPSYADWDPSLAAYYKFDTETSGVTPDATGTYPGTVNGATLKPNDGVYGGAYEFNGVDEFINNISLHPTVDAYTISLWIKPYSLTTRMLFLHHGGASSRQYVEITSSDTISNVHGNDPYTWLQTQETVSAGEWTHYTVTWDGVTMNAYLNGQLDPATQTGNTPVMMAGGSHIGSFYSTLPYYGLADDAGFWTKALNGGQAEQLFLLGLEEFENRGQPSIPEPSSVLFALAGLGLAVRRRKR